MVVKVDVDSTKGDRFSKKTIESCEQRSYLGKTVSSPTSSQKWHKLTFTQTDIEDCADAFISAAKNGSMTGQNIQIGAYKFPKRVAVSDNHVDSGLAMLGRAG